MGLLSKAAREAARRLRRNPDLPMDEASRMQRAREMGFDVDMPLYRGTYADETHAGRGAYHEVWTHPNPEYASGFARSPHAYSVEGVDDGGNVMPLFVRGRLIEPNSAEYQSALAAQQGVRALIDNGVTGLKWGDGAVSIFNEAAESGALRSRFAAFDPARSSDDDLLAAWLLGAPIGGGLLSAASRNRKKHDPMA